MSNYVASLAPSLRLNACCQKATSISKPYNRQNFVLLARITASDLRNSGVLLRVDSLLRLNLMILTSVAIDSKLIHARICSLWSHRVETAIHPH